MPVSGDRGPVNFTRGSARKIAAHLRNDSGDAGDGVAQRRPGRTKPRMPKLARAVGPVTTETQGTFAVWQGHPGGEESANSGETIQAFNYGSSLANNDWVLLHHNGFVWYVAALSTAGLAVCYLNENLPQFGSAGAQICEWNDPVWTPGAGDAITVYDICGSGPADLQTFGIAWLAPSGRWEIIELGAQGTFLVPFYLSSPLTKGGSTSATITTPSAGLSTLWPADGANITVHDVVGRFGPAAIGKRGVAGRIVVDNDPANDVYVIFSLDAEPALQLYLFYLSSPLTKGGSATAKIRTWAAPPLTGGPWAASGGAVTVYDSSSLGPAPQGTDATKHSGVCWLNPDSGRFEIITLTNTPGGTLVPFRLYENLDYGEFADAILLEWDVVDLEWVPSATHITVWDSCHVGPRIAQYDGWAQLDPNSGNYEVVSLSRPALPLNVYYSVENDFTANTELIVGSVMHSWDGPSYDSGRVAKPKEVIVHNVERLDDSKGKYVFKGKTNSMGYAKYNPDSGRYENVWTECPDGAIDEPSSPGYNQEPPPGGGTGEWTLPVAVAPGAGAPFV